MSENHRPEEGLTTSPKLAKRAEEGLTLQPSVKPGSLSLPDATDDEPREYVIRATHVQSGRPLRPFIVRTKDEASARKLAQRNYLSIDSVAVYVPEEGEEKPRTFTYGPPISDKEFEREYANRPADRDDKPTESAWMFSLFGWFFCGPVGAILGGVLGREIDGNRRG